MEGLVPRKWNSSPPIVVVVSSIVVVAAATPIELRNSVVAESVYVADHSQLLLDLRPFGPKSTIIPAWTRDAINLTGLLQDSTSFVCATIQVATIPNTRFQITNRITKLMHFGVDAIFTLRSIRATAIEGTIHIALEIFS